MLLSKDVARTMSPVINAFASQSIQFPAVMHIAYRGDEWATFRLANGEGSFLSLTVPAKGESELQATVHADDVSGWLASSSRDVLFSVPPGGRSLVISEGRSRKRLDVLRGLEPPERRALPQIAVLPHDDLEAIIGEIGYAVERSPYAPLISKGIHLKFSGTQGQLLAQGFGDARGGAARIPAENCRDYTGMLPDNALRLMAATIKAVAHLSPAKRISVTIHGDSNIIAARVDNEGIVAVIESATIALQGELPDVLRAFDFSSGTPVTAALSKTELKRAVSRIGLSGKSAQERHALLWVEDDALMVESSSAGDGTVTRVAVEGVQLEGGETFRVRLNLGFLSSLLRALPGETVWLTYNVQDVPWTPTNSTPALPVRIRSDLSLGTHLIMPVLLEEDIQQPRGAEGDIGT